MSRLALVSSAPAAASATGDGVQSGDAASAPWAFRIAGAARVTGLSEPMIRKLIRTGQLRCIRVGRAVIISSAELRALLHRCEDAS